jgi:glycine/serine hydroxymethyltransferase
VTTRGLKTDHMKQIAAWINEVIHSAGDEATTDRIRRQVHDLCTQYPTPH